MKRVILLWLFGVCYVAVALATDVYDVSPDGAREHVGTVNLPGVESIVIHRRAVVPPEPPDTSIHIRDPADFLPALAKCTGGETVVLHEGEYPAYVNTGNKDIYSDWVTVKAAEGEKVVIEKVTIGARTGSHRNTDATGKYSAYLRFVGIEFADGVENNGGNHFELIDCVVKRAVPLTGSEEAIGRSGIYLAIADGLVKNCEVTHAPIGIYAMGRRVNLIGNHIHDITHDGLRCVSLKESLVEGNRIHGLDDGVTDGQASWSKHCDAIHVFIPGPGLPEMECADLTFRGNVIYATEAHGMQFNDYGSARIRRITIENNIFGPLGAVCVNVASNVDGLTFRHNTFIKASYPWQSQFRTLTMGNSTLRVEPGCTDVAIYNNILHKFDYTPKEGWQVGFNLFADFTPNAPQVRHSVYADPLFADPLKFDGRLQRESPAVNAGTAKLAEVVEKDFYGVTRDKRPDMGAVELEGQDPPAEPDLPAQPENPTVFLEDFADGDWNRVDPWLAGENTIGLSWSGDAYLVSRRGEIQEISKQGANTPAMLLSDRTFESFDFDFTVVNAYIDHSDGVILCYQDESNCYWLDLGKSAGVLYKVVDGESTEIASSAAIRPPHGKSRTYRVHVRAGVGIAVDANRDGTREIEHSDEGVKAGRIGFRRGPYPNASHRNLYHSIRVEAK